MLPTAISDGSGSEFRGPMAVGIIGGVISSTFLTLLVTPVLFLAGEWMRNLVRRKQPVPVLAAAASEERSDLRHSPAE